MPQTAATNGRQPGHLQGLATSEFLDTARRVCLQIDTQVHTTLYMEKQNPRGQVTVVLNYRLQRTLGLDGTYCLLRGGPRKEEAHCIRWE